MGHPPPPLLAQGHVASEITTGDELVLTEMVFNGVFNSLNPEQICSLLSAFIWREKAGEVCGPVGSPLSQSECMLRAGGMGGAPECMLTVVMMPMRGPFSCAGTGGCRLCDARLVSVHVHLLPGAVQEPAACSPGSHPPPGSTPPATPCRAASSCGRTWRHPLVSCERRRGGWPRWQLTAACRWTRMSMSTASSRT